MKQKSLLLTAMVTFAMAAAILLPKQAMAQNVPSYVPTNGLVGWWPFTGNANDESGNGNNGTVNGATLTTDRFGQTNKAYSFDGSSNYIRVQNFISNITTALTVSMWVKINPTNDYQVFLSKGPKISGHFEIYSFITTQKLSYNTIDMCQNIQSSFTITDGQIHHILVVQSNGTLSFYVDNTLVNQIACNGSINNIVNDLTIGKIDDPFPYHANGIIDDIGIWNRELTQQEITALYNGCANPPSASITPNGSTSFCQGGSVTLTANGGNTYNWSTGSANQSITVSTGGSYTVTVTDASNCTAAASQNVTVNPLPSVSINPLPNFTNINANSLSLNGNPAGGSFSGDGVSGNQLNPFAAGLGSTQVTYTYTNANNCTNTSTTNTIVYDTTGVICSSYDTLKIDVNLTGIAPPNNTNQVTVYPNPANDHLLINCGNYNSMSGYNIKITTLLGQVVFNQAVTQQQFYIDLSTWGGTGTYILYIIDPNQTVKSQKQIVLQ